MTCPSCRRVLRQHQHHHQHQSVLCACLLLWCVLVPLSSVQCTSRSYVPTTGSDIIATSTSTSTTTTTNFLNGTVGALISTLDGVDASSSNNTSSALYTPTTNNAVDLSKLHYTSVAPPSPTGATARPGPLTPPPSAYDPHYYQGHYHHHHDHHPHHEQHYYGAQHAPYYHGPYQHQHHQHHQHPPPSHGHYHTHHAYHPHHPPHYYEPIKVVRMSDVGSGRTLLGELFTGMGRAFQNIIAPPSSSSSLLPSSRGMLSRSSEPRFMASQLIERRMPQASTNVSEKSANNNTASLTASSPSPSISTTPGGGENMPQLLPPSTVDYEEERRRLRDQIGRRMEQMQTVLSTAVEVSRERRDFITRRLLEQANTRLEQARKRAEQILKDPQNAERAVRTLNTVGQRLNTLHTFVTSVLGRINDQLSTRINNYTPTDRPAGINDSDHETTTTKAPKEDADDNAN